MNKTVRKLPIEDFWNIGKTESWFSDMASQGLHLKRIGRLFVYFEKAEKANINYRIDVLYDKPSQEQLDVYKEYGWDLVAKTGFFYIFSSHKGSNSPELHTDTVEQSFTLNELDKTLKKSTIVLAIITLFVSGVLFALYYFDDKPFLSLVKGHFIHLIYLAIVYFYGTYSTIRSYLHVRKTKDSLINGVPINHNEDWKKRSLINTIVGTIIVTIAAVTVIIPIMEMVKRDEYTLAERNYNLPIVRLSDIEENPNLQREASYNEEGIDLSNNVRYEWSLLAPTMYKIYERGIVEDIMWPDKSGKYSPSIYTEYYELTIEKMADGVLSDLMHGELYDPRYNEPKKINSTKFDKLYVVEKNNSELTKLIFASWDNNVIYIRYHGNQQVDKIISLILEL